MTKEKDYVIIGAGPAGLQLGYYLQQDRRDYVILERGATAGTFFRRFPRHRVLISNNKVHTGFTDPETNLRWDWNSLLNDSEALQFRNYSKSYFPPADEMVRYLQDFSTKHNLNVLSNKKVVRIERNCVFRLIAEDGEVIGAKRLIMASGVSLPYLPPIPGVEAAEPYTEMPLDPAGFRNQRVLILGKGNSAFETADNLVETAAMIHIASPTPVKMAWKTHFVGHLRAVNNNFLDTYQLKSQNAVLDAHCLGIVRNNGRYTATFRFIHAPEVQDIEYDRVLCCTGFKFDASMFSDETRPEVTINGRFPDQTSAWESANVKDLYFAGMLMQMRDYKKSQSAFIHGFRYNVAALRRILNARHEGLEWPFETIGDNPESLTEAILRRINQASGLWQQFGFLADIVVPNGASARYYTDVPLDYVKDGGLGAGLEYLAVTLEYGHADPNFDPFTSERVSQTDARYAARSQLLHPIIRRFQGDRCVAEHHILENLFSEWKQPQHRLPLFEFVKELRLAAAEH
jgi:thioredoxin reductase